MDRLSPKSLIHSKLPQKIKLCNNFRFVDYPSNPNHQLVCFFDLAKSLEGFNLVGSLCRLFTPCQPMNPLEWITIYLAQSKIDSRMTYS